MQRWALHNFVLETSLLMNEYYFSVEEISDASKLYGLTFTVTAMVLWGYF
jgi:hypothetical protein